MEKAIGFKKFQWSRKTFSCLGVHCLFWFSLSVFVGMLLMLPFKTIFPCLAFSFILFFSVLTGKYESLNAALVMYLLFLLCAVIMGLAKHPFPWRLIFFLAITLILAADTGFYAYCALKSKGLAKFEEHTLT